MSRTSVEAGRASAPPRITPAAVPWLSVAQMREVDRLMIEELGVSLVRMTENAGRNLALVARLLLGGDARDERVLVLAGPGGNGGGGLVAARHLLAAGADVEVRLSGHRRGSLRSAPSSSPSCSGWECRSESARPMTWGSPRSFSTVCSATGSRGHLEARPPR